MAKEKKESTTIDKVKFVFYIVVAVVTILGAIFAVDKYFAKSEMVNTLSDELKQRYDALVKKDVLINERVDISIIDDQIFQQEQTIQKIEDWQRFEQRAVEPELTPIERETLDKAKTRLETLRTRKEDKIRQYEKEDIP